MLLNCTAFSQGCVGGFRPIRSRPQNAVELLPAPPPLPAPPVLATLPGVRRGEGLWGWTLAAAGGAAAVVLGLLLARRRAAGSGRGGVAVALLAAAVAAVVGPVLLLWRRLKAAGGKEHGQLQVCRCHSLRGRSLRSTLSHLGRVLQGQAGATEGDAVPGSAGLPPDAADAKRPEAAPLAENFQPLAHSVSGVSASTTRWCRLPQCFAWHGLRLQLFPGRSGR